MGSRARRGAAIVAVTAAFAVLAANASAEPTKLECFSASQNGQDLQRNGKLLDSRAAFLTCSAASCPEIVRADCAQHVDDIQRALPSIVFEARDEDGNELGAVKVTLDGAPFIDHLDGRSLLLDPGERRFAFAVEGRATVEKSFVIREGEKERHERIVFPGVPRSPAPALVPPPAPSSVVTTPTTAPAPAAPPSTTASSTPPEAPSSRGHNQRLLAYAVGGVGIVGLGVGGAFAVTALSKWSQAQSECGGGCAATSPARSDKSAADSAANASTIAFIAGGAALVAGIALFFTAPKSERAVTAMHVVPSVGPSSEGVVLLGSF